MGEAPVLAAVVLVPFVCPGSLSGIAGIGDQRADAGRSIIFDRTIHALDRQAGQHTLPDATC